MIHPIIYIDRSRIREGNAEQVRSHIHQLVDFIESRETQLIGYEFYFDELESLMTVIAIHPDSKSLETHMELGREAFREFAALIDMQSIQVYGQPSERVVQLLDQKAEMLGEHGRVEVHRRQAGFARVSPSHSRRD